MFKKIVILKNFKAALFWHEFCFLFLDNTDASKPSNTASHCKREVNNFQVQEKKKSYRVKNKQTIRLKK